MVRQPRPQGDTSRPASPSSPASSRRPALHAKKDSATNTLRLVPSRDGGDWNAEAERATILRKDKDRDNDRDPVYGRTALPTKPEQILAPHTDQGRPVSERSDVSQTEGKSATPTSSNRPHETAHRTSPATPSVPTSPRPKRRLQVDPENPHLFKLVASTSAAQDDDHTRSIASTITPKSPRSPRSPASSFVSSSSPVSCTAPVSPDPFTFLPSNSPATVPLFGQISSPVISADPISGSSSSDGPWHYRPAEQSIRKVPKTPESSKQVPVQSAFQAQSPPISDETLPHERNLLSNKSSFATTESDHSNYKVYRSTTVPLSSSASNTNSNTSDNNATNWEVLGGSSSSGSEGSRQRQTSNNWEILEESSSTGSVIHHKPKSSGNNWTSFGELSSPESISHHPPPSPSDNWVAQGDTSSSASVVHKPSHSSSNWEAVGDLSASGSVIHHPSQSSNNWEVLGDSSPAASVVHHPSQSSNNWEVLGESSPAASVFQGPIQSSDIDDESISYVPTPSIRPAYSQESLVIPPLNPVRTRPSNERLGYYRQHSRESLRTGSLTSISTVLSQKEAQKAVVGSGTLVNHLSIPVLKKTSSGAWADTSRGTQGHMTGVLTESPHVWSSQLSTIGSVSEESTIDRASQSWSARRSAHSRNVLSISSSLEARSRTGSLSLEPPRPAFARNSTSRYTNYSGSSVRLVEDSLDEDGDGLGDLNELRNRPSRSRLSLVSSDGRSYSMRSTSSSRANSLLANSIPTWAKIYYGSGERKYLGVGAPGSSISSESGSRSNSMRSGSPSDHFPLSIYSPRKRPREGQPETTRGQGAGPDDIAAVPGTPVVSRPWRTSRSSSIWSPHLRRTDLAARRLTLWDVPSTNGSVRSTTQITLFAIGFIFPFSWFIGALLKLPPNPVVEMQHADESSANLDNPHNYDLEFGPSDEKRYESARWWRRLNRIMSVFGVIVIAVVIILVVLGLRESWGS
ncbi:hypothetical protein BP5796_08589 [Coleophoma crateriformis]|uniref:Serine-rich protein n=1 Tax=Coleophoma crateriformis TaxID=565419 RepID=A0A3D8R812_9HELO|nr:hypothetical protein BP5796_08589 [Coleophoma crateriformis]